MNNNEYDIYFTIDQLKEISFSCNVEMNLIEKNSVEHGFKNLNVITQKRYKTLKKIVNRVHTKLGSIVLDNM